MIVPVALALSVSLPPIAPLPAEPHTAPLSAERPRAEPITFRGAGGVHLRGTVFTPASAPPKTGRPAMVLVHGSGQGKRERLVPVAKEFARHGVVTLVYDKRTKGYSAFQRDYSLLADDALAAHRVLAARRGVDRDKVGVWGVSEGGWVAPLAASRSRDVGFLITVAANSVTPASQEQWNLATKLDYHGIRGSLVRAYSETFTRLAIGVGLFSEANYDTLPVLRRIRQPVLGLWGEYDRLTPPGESSTTFRRTFESAGNDRVTLRIVPDADHGLHRTPDRGFTRSEELAPGWVERAAAWIAAPPPSSADPAPSQSRTTIPMPPLAWYESPWMQLAAFLLLIGIFLGRLIRSLVRRIRSTGRTHPSADWLAACGVLSTTGLVGYFAYLTATTAETFGPVVLGRPLPWLLLQLFAVGAVAALTATAVSWWHDRDRLPMTLVAGLLFIPWALYWGLLVP